MHLSAWCIVSLGVNTVAHYLDDFAVMSPPDSEVTLKAVWSKLCIPLAPEKQEGPSTELTFLGLGGNPGSLDSTQDKHT